MCLDAENPAHDLGNCLPLYKACRECLSILPVVDCRYGFLQLLYDSITDSKPFSIRDAGADL